MRDDKDILGAFSMIKDTSYLDTTIQETSPDLCVTALTKQAICLLICLNFSVRHYLAQDQSSVLLSE